MTFVAIVIVGMFLFAESMLRLYRLRYSPWGIKIAYALYLLSRRAYHENRVINQRIERGGFGSEDELMHHYSLVSGKSVDEIKALLRPISLFESVFSRCYFSGLHGVVEERQEMPLGKVPASGQTLQTIATDEHGRRKTGFDGKPEQSDTGLRILFLGGSTAYGFGATSDANTIPGKVGHYVKQALGTDVTIVNGAYMGFTSYQEVISLLDMNEQFDYVISLSGWNDIDQRMSNAAKISSLAVACDNEANRHPLHSFASRLAARSEIIGVTRRFMDAYRAYDDTDNAPTAPHAEIYPMY